MDEKPREPSPPYDRSQTIWFSRNDSRPSAPTPAPITAPPGSTPGSAYNITDTAGNLATDEAGVPLATRDANGKPHWLNRAERDMAFVPPEAKRARQMILDHWQRRAQSVPEMQRMAATPQAGTWKAAQEAASAFVSQPARTAAGVTRGFIPASQRAYEAFARGDTPYYYDPESTVNQLAAGAGQALPMAAAALLGGPAAAGAMGFGLSGASTYNEARDKGAGVGTALAAGALSGGVEMLTEAASAGLGRTLGKNLAMPLVKKLGGTLAANTAEEVASQIGQNLVAKGLYDPNQGVFEGVKQAAVGGIGGGMAMSPLTAVSHVQERAAAQAVLDKTINESKRINNSGERAVVSRRPTGENTRDAITAETFIAGRGGSQPVWFRGDERIGGFQDPQTRQIFLNAADPVAAARYSAAHELAHKIRAENPQAQAMMDEIIAQNPDLRDTLTEIYRRRATDAGQNDVATNFDANNEATAVLAERMMDRPEMIPPRWRTFAADLFLNTLDEIGVKSPKRAAIARRQMRFLDDLRRVADEHRPKSEGGPSSLRDSAQARVVESGHNVAAPPSPVASGVSPMVENQGPSAGNQPGNVDGVKPQWPSPGPRYESAPRVLGTRQLQRGFVNGTHDPQAGGKILAELYRHARNTRDDSPRGVVYAQLSAADAARLNEAIAKAPIRRRDERSRFQWQATDEYLHTADVKSLRHADNRHGLGSERDGSQEPLTDEDARLIPEVTRPENLVELSVENGQPFLQYEKRFNGKVIVVQQVRTGRKSLHVYSAWKKRSGGESRHPSSPSPSLAPGFTPEVTGRMQSPPPDNTIAPTALAVKEILPTVAPALVAPSLSAPQAPTPSASQTPASVAGTGGAAPADSLGKQNLDDTGFSFGGQRSLENRPQGVGDDVVPAAQVPVTPESTQLHAASLHPDTPPPPVPTDVGAAFAGGRTHIGRRILPKGQVHIDNPVHTEQALRELWDYSVNAPKPPEARAVAYRVVDPSEAESLKARTGEDYSNYEHIADSFAARHGHLEHGILTADELQGQVPFTADDFAKIPEVTRPENIVRTSKNKRGQDVVVYKKAYNGHWIIAEEVRNKRGQLAVVSTVKTKRGSQPDEGKASSSPSRQLRVTPPQDDTISPTALAVKEIPPTVAPALVAPSLSAPQAAPTPSAGQTPTSVTATGGAAPAGAPVKVVAKPGELTATPTPARSDDNTPFSIRPRSFKARTGVDDAIINDLPPNTKAVVSKWLDELHRIETDPRFFDKSTIATTLNDRAGKLRYRLGFALKNDAPVERYGPDAPGQPEHVERRWRYVQAPDGTADFGRITDDMVKAAAEKGVELRPLPVRLQHGRKDVGELHMEVEHGEQLRASGFASVRDFVWHVGSGIDRVVLRKDGGISLARQNARRGVVYIDLHPTSEAYVAVAGFPGRNVAGETLWDRSTTRSRDSGPAGPAIMPLESESPVEVHPGIPDQGSGAKAPPAINTIPPSSDSVKKNLIAGQVPDGDRTPFNFSGQRPLENRPREAGDDVVRVKGDELFDFSTEPIDIRAAREAALNWVEQRSPKTVTNPSLGWEIYLDRNKVKGSLSHGAGPQKIQSVAALPELLAVAKLAQTHDVANGKDHILAARMKLGDQEYAIGMVVKQRGRHFFYDHELTEIENLAALSPQAGTKAGKRRGSIMSIVANYLRVKQNPPAGQTPDSDRTPFNFSGQRPLENPPREAGGNVPSAVDAKPDVTLNRGRAIMRTLKLFDNGNQPVLLTPKKLPFYISSRSLQKATAAQGEGGKLKPFQRQRIAAIQSLDELGPIAREVRNRPDDGRDPNVTAIREFEAFFRFEGHSWKATLLAKEFSPRAKLRNKLHSMSIEDVTIEKMPADHKTPGGLVSQLDFLGGRAAGLGDAATAPSLRNQKNIIPEVPPVKQNPPAGQTPDSDRTPFNFSGQRPLENRPAAEKARQDAIMRPGTGEGETEAKPNKTIRISGNELKNFEELRQQPKSSERWKAMRNAALSWAAKNVHNQSFANDATGRQIKVKIDAVRHAQSFRANEDAIASVIALPEMIRKGVPGQPEPYKGQEPHIRRVIPFTTHIDIGDRSYRTRLTVFEKDNGELLYTWRLQNERRVPSQMPGRDHTIQLQPEAEPSNNTIVPLSDPVKPNPSGSGREARFSFGGQRVELAQKRPTP